MPRISSKYAVNLFGPKSFCNAVHLFPLEGNEQKSFRGKPIEMDSRIKQLTK
jgi:hypothetical protein